MARLQPPRLRADLHHVDRARVVDVDRRLRELVARGGEPRPVVGRELAGAQPLRLDLRLAAHQALRHLGLRHLEREHPDRDALAHGHVRGHAERERRLPHRRARGDDDQVARLEAGREPVEVAVAGRRAGDVDARLVERRDALEALLQQLVDVRELAADALLREVEDDLLGAVDEITRLAGTLPAEAGDLAAGTDEAAQRRRLPHDPRVVRGVRGRGDESRELVQADATPDVLQLAALLQLVGQRDRVHRLALRVEREGGAVDLRVRLPVEVARVEDLAHGPDRARGEHHRAREPIPRLRGSGAGRWRRSGTGASCAMPADLHHARAAAATCRRVCCEHVFLRHLQGNQPCVAGASDGATVDSSAAR